MNVFAIIMIIAAEKLRISNDDLISERFLT